MLNLTAKTKPQEKIKAYLEANASETLAEKINSGAQIEKDGVRLISKKTLDGFMRYAAEEARKLADKGATSACVEDETVYGWAVHYFEEDTIEGTLYNEDGTEYKPQKTEEKKAVEQRPFSNSAAKKEQPKTQFSIFDMMSAEDTVKGSVNEKPVSDDILGYNFDDEHDEDVSEEIRDKSVPAKPDRAEEQTAAETEETAADEDTKNPVFVRYRALSEKNPGCVVALRLGDFYEILGKNAVTVAAELNLTLTGRDLGLSLRVPMVGFPFYAADMYFKKIHERHPLVVADDEGEQIYGLCVDTATGEIIEEAEGEPDLSAFDRDVIMKLDVLFGNKITLG